MIYKETYAGFGAGLFGTLIGYPFDTVKTKLQTDPQNLSMLKAFRNIYEKDGVMSFYRGVTSPLIALTILNMMNFTSYAYFKNRIGIKDTYNHGSFQPLIFFAGAAAGPFAAFVSTPFELVKIQMQISKSYHNSFQALRAILSQNGLKTLYRGHSINTLRECTFLGSYFLVYEHSRMILEKSISSSFAIPFAGGISGALGWFISFPLDSVKANIQV